MHIAVVQRLQGDPKGPKHSIRTPKKYLNLTVENREPSKFLLSALLLKLSSEFVFQFFDDFLKNQDCVSQKMLNQPILCNLKDQRNWRTTFLMLSFLIGIICILLHRPKKITLIGKSGIIKFEFQTTQISWCSS